MSYYSGNSKQIIGQICQLGELMAPILLPTWSNIELQLYENNTNHIVRHTGVLVTLQDRDKRSTKHFCLDWGQDSEKSGFGKLQISSLDEDDLIQHGKENTLLVNKLAVPLNSETVRLQLVQALNDMHSTFNKIGYALFEYDPNGSEMNCRGFCHWIMNRFRCVHDNPTDKESKTGVKSLDNVQSKDTTVFWSTIGGIGALFIGSVVTSVAVSHAVATPTLDDDNDD